jgi:hypothetical protein
MSQPFGFVIALAPRSLINAASYEQKISADNLSRKPARAEADRSTAGTFHWHTTESSK